MDEQRRSGISRSPLSSYGGPSTVSAGMAGSLAQRTGTPSIVSQGLKGSMSSRYGGPSTVSAGLAGTLSQRTGTPSVVRDGLAGSVSGRSGTSSVVSDGMSGTLAQRTGAPSIVADGMRAAVGAGIPQRAGIIQRAVSRMGGALRGPEAAAIGMLAGGAVAFGGMNQIIEGEGASERLGGVARAALGASSFLPGAAGALGRIASAGLLGSDVAGGVAEGLRRTVAQPAGDDIAELLAAVPAGRSRGATAPSATTGDPLQQMLSAVPSTARVPAVSAAPVPGAPQRLQTAPDVAAAPGPIARAAQRRQLQQPDALSPTAPSPVAQAQVQRLQAMAGQELDAMRSAPGAPGLGQDRRALSPEEAVDFIRRQREAEQLRREDDERSRYAREEWSAAQAQAAREAAALGASRSRALNRRATESMPIDFDALLDRPGF